MSFRVDPYREIEKIWFWKIMHCFTRNIRWSIPSFIIWIHSWDKFTFVRVFFSKYKCKKKMCLRDNYIIIICKNQLLFMFEIQFRIWRYQFQISERDIIAYPIDKWNMKEFFGYRSNIKFTANVHFYIPIVYDVVYVISAHWLHLDEDKLQKLSKPHFLRSYLKFIHVKGIYIFRILYFCGSNNLFEIDLMVLK